MAQAVIPLMAFDGAREPTKSCAPPSKSAGGAYELHCGNASISRPAAPHFFDPNVLNPWFLDRPGGKHRTSTPLFHPKRRVGVKEHLPWHTKWERRASVNISFSFSPENKAVSRSGARQRFCIPPSDSGRAWTWELWIAGQACGLTKRSNREKMRRAGGRCASEKRRDDWQRRAACCFRWDSA